MPGTRALVSTWPGILLVVMPYKPTDLEAVRDARNAIKRFVNLPETYWRETNDWARERLCQRADEATAVLTAQRQSHGYLPPI